MSSNRNLKIVKLLEPELCVECRFARMATVEDTKGNFTRMIHCQRGDCDNWDYDSAERAKSIVDEEEVAPDT